MSVPWSQHETALSESLSRLKERIDEMGRRIEALPCCGDGSAAASAQCGCLCCPLDSPRGGEPKETKTAQAAGSDAAPVSGKIPHACPVCGGHKTVQKPPHVAGDQDTWMAADCSIHYPCPACDGTGVVWEVVE